MKKIPIEEIKAIYLSTKNDDYNWFGRSETNYFNSIYPAYGFKVPKASIYYFITGESEYPVKNLRYTIRILKDGKIKSFNGFMRYSTYEIAERDLLENHDRLLGELR